MRRHLITLAALFLASTARAEEPRYQAAELGLVLGGKVGAGLAQPFGDFGASALGELELGYLLPFLSRGFEVLTSLSYRAPSAAGEVTDARLPGNAVLRYELERRELVLGLGLRYRVPIPTAALRPYAGLAAHASFTELEIEGAAGGQSTGVNEDTRTYYGFSGTLGAELFLGPGAVLGEVRIDVTPVDGLVLRDTNASTLTLAAGYRIFL